MKHTRTYQVLVSALTMAIVSTTGMPALAAGEKAAVYGGDLTAAERQELSQAFGMGSPEQGETVTTAELAAALAGTSLTVVPDDKTISSAGLTCLDKAAGLTVKTQNITRMTASVYANALVTAGVGDADVLVAAPTANPVSGETALVGVLKAFPQCQGGKPPEPERVRLAYEQIGRTAALAGPDGDVGKASTVMLKAAQPVITRQARDDGAIEAALNSAAESEGMQIDPVQRPELIAFFKRLGGVDYGTYAQGYQVQQQSATEVKVTPSGAGAPATAGTGSAAAGAAAAPASATTPANPAAAPQTLTGEVTRVGQPLTVRADGQDRQITTAPAVAVTRDGRSAQIGDIRTGDRVVTTLNPDGTAQRIEATSANGLPWWLLPLLGLLALGLGLLWFAAKRKKDSFIVERKAPVAAGSEPNATRRS